MTKKNTDQTSKKQTEKSEPKIIRKTTEYLRVDYTPEELANKAQEMAAKAAELDAISDEKAAVVSNFGTRIKQAKGQLDVLTDQVRSKGEHRSVKCEWHMNTPRKGRKTLYRIDTQAVVREDEMLDSDAQMVLDDVKARNGETERTVEEKTVGTVGVPQ